jgi:hypothetical protein
MTKRIDWSGFKYPLGCGLSAQAKEALIREANNAKCNPSPSSMCRLSLSERCPLDVEKDCNDKALDMANEQRNN